MLVTEDIVEAFHLLSELPIVKQRQLAQEAEAAHAEEKDKIIIEAWRDKVAATLLELARAAVAAQNDRRAKS